MRWFLINDYEYENENEYEISKPVKALVRVLNFVNRGFFLNRICQD